MEPALGWESDDLASWFRQVVRIGNRSPEWRWLKDKEGKAHENRTKEVPRTGVRTSGRANCTPGCPIYIGQAQGEKKMHKKKSRRAKGPGLSLFPVLWGTLLFVSLGQHPLMPRGWVVLLLSKQNRAVTRSCNTDLSKSYNTVCLRPENCDTPRGL